MLSRQPNTILNDQGLFKKIYDAAKNNDVNALNALKAAYPNISIFDDAREGAPEDAQLWLDKDRDTWTPAEKLFYEKNPNAGALLINMGATHTYYIMTIMQQIGCGYLSPYYPTPSENVDFSKITNTDIHDDQITYQDKSWYVLRSKFGAAFTGEIYRLMAGTHHPKTLAAYTNGSLEQTDEFYYVMEAGYNNYCCVLSEAIPGFKSFKDMNTFEQYDFTQTKFLNSGGAATLVALYLMNETDFDPSNTGINHLGQICKIDLEYSLYPSTEYEISEKAINNLPKMNIGNTIITPLTRWFGRQSFLPASMQLATIENNERYQYEKFKYLLKFIMLDEKHFDEIHSHHIGKQMDGERKLAILKKRRSMLANALPKDDAFIKFMVKHHQTLLTDIFEELFAYNANSVNKLSNLHLAFNNYINTLDMLGISHETHFQPVDTSSKQEIIYTSPRDERVAELRTQLDSSLNVLRDNLLIKQYKGRKLSEAEIEIWLLVNQLKDETDTFFSQSITKNGFDQFEAKFKKLLDDKQKAIDSHTDWKQAITNALQIISLIGIIVGIVKFAYNGHFFFKMNTDSQNKLNKTKEKMDDLRQYITTRYPQ
jgi:hypothetical protein